MTAEPPSRTSVEREVQVDQPRTSIPGDSADFGRPDPREPDPALIAVTRVVYRLHALSLAAGVLVVACVLAGKFVVVALLGALLYGWPSIVAVVINYLRRKEVRDTWLESHFNWQIRTYWIGRTAVLVMLPIAIPLMVLLVYSPIGLNALVMPGELAKLVSGLGGNPNALQGLPVLLFIVMLVVSIAGVCFLPVRVWEIYRITRGWLALNAREPIKPRR